MNEEYIAWLYSLVGKDTRKYGHYWRLIRFLQSREFFYTVKNDDNRAKDGVKLRDSFALDYHYRLDEVNEYLYGPCRLLEMLVAFAVRINEEIMWDPDKGDRTALWFWTMVENLVGDLEAYSDEYFNGDSIIKLHELVNIALQRLYSKTGNGSFFPIKSGSKDLRKMELWYQMHAWFGENYPI